MNNPYDYRKAATETVISYLQALVEAGALGDLSANAGYDAANHAAIVSDLVDRACPEAAHSADPETPFILNALTLCLDMADWAEVVGAVGIPYRGTESA